MRAHPDYAHLSVDLDDDEGDLVVIDLDAGVPATGRALPADAARDAASDRFYVVARSEDSARQVRAVLEGRPPRATAPSERLVAILVDE